MRKVDFTVFFTIFVTRISVHKISKYKYQFLFIPNGNMKQVVTYVVHTFVVLNTISFSRNFPEPSNVNILIIKSRNFFFSNYNLQDAWCLFMSLSFKRHIPCLWVCEKFIKETKRILKITQFHSTPFMHTFVANTCKYLVFSSPNF